MIVLIEDMHAKRIIKKYLCDVMNDFILRLLGIYSFNTGEGKKYFYLLSFDYVKDNKDLSLITLQLNDSKNTCKCDLCHKQVNKVFVFKDCYNLWSDDVFTNVCSRCITKKSGFKDNDDNKTEFFINEIKRVMLTQELVKFNNSELLCTIMENTDKEDNIMYQGYTIRETNIRGKKYYFLNISDVYIINPLTSETKEIGIKLEKDSPRMTHVNNEQDLYLVNYFYLLRSLNTEAEQMQCFSNLLQYYTISEMISGLMRVTKLLDDLTTYLKIEESSIMGNRKELNNGDMSVKKKMCLLGNVGDHYTNAKVKLVKIKKNNKDFFKGRYKNLYRLYFGYYQLLWNTSLDLPDGSYVCSFNVHKHVVTKNEVCTVITNCRTKQLI